MGRFFRPFRLSKILFLYFSLKCVICFLHSVTAETERICTFQNFSTFFIKISTDTIIVNKGGIFMSKFINGMIAGVVVGSATSMVVNSMHGTDKTSKKTHKTLGKTLHSLGDMAENIAK